MINKTIALPSEVMESLRKEAHEKGWNVSTLIISLMHSHLSHQSGSNKSQE